MIAALLNLMFDCWHSNYSFPITAPPKRRLHSAAQMTGMYVVCLDCGKEFPYCWNTMRIVSASDVLQYANGSGDPQSNETSPRYAHKPFLLQKREVQDPARSPETGLPVIVGLGGLRHFVSRIRGSR